MAVASVAAAPAIAGTGSAAVEARTCRCIATCLGLAFAWATTASLATSLVAAAPAAALEAAAVGVACSAATEFESHRTSVVEPELSAADWL